MLLLDCKDFSQNHVLWEPWKNDYHINSLDLSLKVLLVWSIFRFSFGLLNILTKSERTSYLLAGAHGLMMHLSQLLYRDSFVYVVGRQRDNNLQHYSLGQLLQQLQTFYEFADMPMYDVYMEDLSLSPGISLRCTTHSNSAFQQKKQDKR